jgi:hypothetical protein
MSINRFPSKLAAYEAGREAGLREAQELASREGEGGADDADGPAPMTLDAIKAGKFTNEELVTRKDEVDALLAGGEAA